MLAEGASVDSGVDHACSRIVYDSGRGVRQQSSRGEWERTGLEGGAWVRGAPARRRAVPTYVLANCEIADTGVVVARELCAIKSTGAVRSVDVAWGAGRHVQ